MIYLKQLEDTTIDIRYNDNIGLGFFTVDNEIEFVRYRGKNRLSIGCDVDKSGRLIISGVDLI